MEIGGAKLKTQQVSSNPQNRQTSHSQIGAPNDCFLLNICSEKQILRRIFYHLRKAKNF